MEQLQQIIGAKGEWVELHLPDEDAMFALVWLRKEEQDGYMEEKDFNAVPHEIHVTVRATPKLMAVFNK